MVEDDGFEPPTPACKADALPAELILHIEILLPGNVLLLRNVSPTTIGAKELNFCVRHGNRCDLFAIITRQLLYSIYITLFRTHLQQLILHSVKISLQFIYKQSVLFKTTLL